MKPRSLVKTPRDVTLLAIESARSIRWRETPGGDDMPLRKDVARFMAGRGVVSHRWVNAIERSLEIVPAPV